jgi:hypothetical protein
VRKPCIPLLTAVYFEFVNRYSLRNAVYCCQHTLLSNRTELWLNFCPRVPHDTVIKQFASPSSSLSWLLTFFGFILNLESVRRLWRFLLLGGLPVSDFQQGQRTFSPPPKSKYLRELSRFLSIRCGGKAAETWSWPFTCTLCQGLNAWISPFLHPP